MTVNAAAGQSLMNVFWNDKQASNTAGYWNQPAPDQTGGGLWQYVSEQVDVQVSMCLERVGDRLVYDLAGQTAEYLSEHEDLADDYVLVIIDEPGQPRRARAYRREDLAAQMPEEQQEAALKALKENPLLYHDSAADLPPAPDDEDLAGLAETAQGFLDKYEDVLDILDRDGHRPWREKR